MASVFDVCQYVLVKTGDITAMKLQKLCYYSQAWSLVWNETPLFNDKIEAWANGPVIPALYWAHRGQFLINSISQGSVEKLSDSQKGIIDKIVDFYGQYNPQQLSDLTHIESPWRDARGGIPDGVRCDKEITHASMMEYYSQL